MQGLPAGSEARLTVASYLERQRAAEESQHQHDQQSSSGTASQSSTQQHTQQQDKSPSSPTLRSDSGSGPSGKQRGSASPTNVSRHSKQSQKSEKSQGSADAPVQPIKSDQQLEQQDDSMRGEFERGQDSQDTDGSGQGGVRDDESSSSSSYSGQASRKFNEEQGDDQGQDQGQGQADPDEVVEEQIERAKRTQFVPESHEPLSKTIGYEVERPDLEQGQYQGQGQQDQGQQGQYRDKDQVGSDEVSRLGQKLEQTRLEEQVKQQQQQDGGKLKSLEEFEEVLEKEQKRLAQQQREHRQTTSGQDLEQGLEREYQQQRDKVDKELTKQKQDVKKHLQQAKEQRFKQEVGGRSQDQQQQQQRQQDFNKDSGDDFSSSSSSRRDKDHDSLRPGDDKFAKDVEQMKQEQQHHLKESMGSTKVDLHREHEQQQGHQPAASSDSFSSPSQDSGLLIQKSDLPRHGAKQQQMGRQKLESEGDIPESEMETPMRNQPFHHAQYERAKDPSQWTSAEAEAHLMPSHYQTPTATAIPASEYDQRHLSEKASPLEGSEEIRSGAHEVIHGLTKSLKDLKNKVSDTFHMGKHEVARSVERSAAHARANAEEEMALKQTERAVDRATEKEIEDLKLMGDAAQKALHHPPQK